MTAQELSEYCRSKGLYPEQIERWKQAFIQGFSPSKAGLKLKAAQKEIQQIKKDMTRKDKALAETAAMRERCLYSATCAAC